MRCKAGRSEAEGDAGGDAEAQEEQGSDNEDERAEQGDNEDEQEQGDNEDEQEQGSDNEVEQEQGSDNEDEEQEQGSDNEDEEQEQGSDNEDEEQEQGSDNKDEQAEQGSEGEDEDWQPGPRDGSSDSETCSDSEEDGKLSACEDGSGDHYNETQEGCTYAEGTAAGLCVETQVDCPDSESSNGDDAAEPCEIYGNKPDETEEQQSVASYTQEDDLSAVKDGSESEEVIPVPAGMLLGALTSTKGGSDSDSDGDTLPWGAQAGAEAETTACEDKPKLIRKNAACFDDDLTPVGFAGTKGARFLLSRPLSTNQSAVANPSFRVGGVANGQTL